MKSKHIAYLIFRTRENTGTHVVFNHAQALKLLGYTVSIYTLFGNSASWYPKGMSTQSILYYKHSDVLVATFWPTAYIAALLPAVKKFYMIMGFEAAFHSFSIIRFFAVASYNLPLNKLTVSKYLKDRVEKYIKREKSVAVIKTFIPDLIFSRKSNKSMKKSVILSVVSWYNNVKGIDLLDNTIKNLKQQGVQAEFILVSREKAIYSSVFDRFYPNPSRKKLRSLYTEATLLLATSRTEGFYIPGLEAMGNKCLFVTTNSGGILEYAKNGENAIIVEKLSDLWKKSLVKKALTNVKFRTPLLEKGYETAREYKSYTLRDLGKDLEQMYFTKDVDQ